MSTLPQRRPSRDIHRHDRRRDFATESDGLGRPTGGQDYIAEIKKVKDKP